MDESCFPVLEMHSSMHDAATIASFLLRFRAEYSKITSSWPPFKVLVTDCSWALINATILAFNKCDVETYLLWMYENAFGQRNLSKIVVLKLCAVHFFKKIADRLKDEFKNKRIRKFYKFVIVKLINATTFAEFSYFCTHFLYFLDSKYLDSKALKSYVNIISKNKVVFELPQRIIHLESKETSLYSKSFFYHHFRNVNDVKSNGKINPAHSPEFAIYMRKFWLPICPMWSSFISPRVTNNMVESYFKHIKVDIMGNELRKKPGRVIRAIHDDTRGKFNAHLFQIPKKKIKYVPVDSLNVTEDWNSKTSSPNWFTQTPSNLSNYLGNLLSI